MREREFSEEIDNCVRARNEVSAFLTFSESSAGVIGLHGTGTGLRTPSSTGSCGWLSQVRS